MTAENEAIVDGVAVGTESQCVGYFLDNPKLAMSISDVREMISATYRLGSMLNIRPDRCVAQIAHETNRGAFTGDVSVKQKNPAGIGTVGGSVAGLSYPSWSAGIVGYFVHLVAWLGGPAVVPAIGALYTVANDPRLHLVESVREEKGAATTWASLGSRWAVPGIGYGAGMDRHLAGILGMPHEEKTMGHVPKPPITDLIAKTMLLKRDGVGFDSMDHNRVPCGTVMHSMGGTLEGTTSHFALASTQALTDYAIGQTEFRPTPGFAEIRQFCDPLGTIEPWASGPIGPSASNPNGRPEGDGPAYLAKFGGADGLNETAVAIEHDDTTYGDGTYRRDGDGNVIVGQTPMSAYAWASSVWLQAWLHAELLRQTADNYAWNMFHREFCGRAYKNCPNDRIIRYVDEYQGAVKAIMRHFQEGTPYPDGGLVINGLRIATPPEAAAVPKPPPLSTNTPPENYDPVTGHYIAEQLLPFWRQLGGIAFVGRPRAGMVLYSDGKLRQLFDNLALSYDPKTNATAIEGLGIAYQEQTGSIYPVWSTAKPFV